MDGQVGFIRRRGEGCLGTRDGEGEKDRTRIGQGEWEKDGKVDGWLE